MTLAPALEKSATAAPTGSEAAFRRPLLSVVVKAFNEEANIAVCLASVLAATQSYPTEIIVADSRSSDATASIALDLGATVVRLAASEPRGCGIGAQLGFQHATGEYVLLIDGDMRLDASFLPAALAALGADVGLAGVGGLVELDEANLEYRIRRQRNARHLRPGNVDRLDGGGLYRRAAIVASGYLSDRNLHSFEELELAMRLRHAGWRLRRISVVSVHHKGHTVSAVRLLLARWRNRYADGQGEALRAALGSDRLLPLLREFWVSLAVIGWWLSLALYGLVALALGLSLLPELGLLLLPIAVMAMKRRSLIAAIYSIALWQVTAAGLLRGLLRRRRDPRAPIACEVMRATPPHR